MGIQGFVGPSLAAEFLRGTDLPQLYLQRVGPKPSSHSLDINSVVTFAQDIRPTIHVGVHYKSIFRAIQPTVVHVATEEVRLTGASDKVS